MSLEARIYQLLVIIGTFASALLPAWVAIEIFRNQAPTKSLEVSTSYTNPIDSLGSLKERAKLNLTVGERTFDNLTVASVTITNRGTTPITDSDIKSPLTATTSNKWNIIAVGEFEVGGRAFPRAISWENRDGVSIVASTPFLLNQGESYTFPVYMTKRSVPVSNNSSESDRITLFWTARIVGLPDIKNTEYGNVQGGWAYTEPNLLDQVIVTLTARNVFALFAIAFPLAWLYLHLLGQISLPHETRSIRTACAIGLVFISIAVAEVSQSYLGPPDGYTFYRPRHVEWLNGTIVAVGLILAIILYIQSRLERTTRIK